MFHIFSVAAKAGHTLYDFRNVVVLFHLILLESIILRSEARAHDECAHAVLVKKAR